MPEMSPNPYAAPAEASSMDFDAGREQLAGRVTRLGAAMLDGILMGLIVFPVQFMTGFFGRVQTQQAGLVEQLAMSLLGMGVYLLLNGYLLVTRGQSIGKLAGKIQIVDFQSGGLLPFLRVYVYRYLWSLPLIFVVLLIPGPIDDMLANVVILIDSLLIFRSDRRCLHDLIAGSKVVQYRPDRQRLAA
jgi:uncharacterized RDD family membrane protein YckC